MVEFPETTAHVCFVFSQPESSAVCFKVQTAVLEPTELRITLVTLDGIVFSFKAAASR